MEGLRVLWRGLRHLNHRGYIYIWANVLWFVLSLPIITAPAAWAGLVRMTHTAHTKPSASLSDFWDGFRENLWRGVVLGVLNALIIGINIVNIAAYRGAAGMMYDLMRLVWVLALFVWLTIQLYLWPLFYEMKQPNMVGAMRNAGLMFLLNPFFSMGLWLGIVVVVLISTVLMIPWMLFTVSVIAVFVTGAVLNRLEAAGLRKPLPVSNEYAAGESEA
jgi:uncharacterized membrane protein YesL